MKQKNIIRAYKVVNRFYNEKLPLDISYKFFRLRKLLTPQFEFQRDKEQEIIDKYDPDVSPDGSVKFADENQQKSFMDEYSRSCNELAEMDVDIGEFDKIPIHLGDALELSIEDIEALSDFVDFVD